jgi:hypothetical protein
MIDLVISLLALACGVALGVVTFLCCSGGSS